MSKPKTPSRFKKGGSKKKVKQPAPKKPVAKEPEVEEIDQDEFVVVGKNPVLEALRSDMQIDRVLILKDNTDHVLKDISTRSKNKNIVVQSVDKVRLEKISEGRPHQGVAALLSPFPYTDLETIIEDNKDSENVILVICDHVTDPHNFGAIIRNAEVTGAKGVIFPQRRSAGLSPTTVKSSSGAVAYIPLSKVGNLSQAIKKLKENNYWIAGTDMNGQSVYETDLTGKIAFVLGSEGSGLSPLIKRNCDYIVSIPDYGKVDSMNVSSASAVILSQAAYQQHK